MKKLVLGLLTFMGLNLAHATVSISKEYVFPVASVASLEAKIQKAYERESELQEYPAFYEVDKGSGISLWCPPHQPDKDGKGCSLSVLLKLPDGTLIGIRKKLAMSGKAREVQARLALVDPNSTQDHQHFGSFFEPQDTFGSHYFCEPDGAIGAKTWKCSLYVNESLN